MNIQIKATMREKGKKSVIKQQRRDDFIPAVIYGEGKTGINILLAKTDFMKSYKKSIGEVAIFEITIAGKNYRTFIKDKQMHPVSREFIHLDFVELHKGKPITLEIPLHYFGEAKGVREGGALEILHHSLEITCLPKDLPEEIQIDVSNLNIGDSIHFADIDLPEGVSTNMTDITNLVSVRAPRQIVESEEEKAEEVTLTEGEEEAEASELPAE